MEERSESIMLGGEDGDGVRGDSGNGYGSDCGDGGDDSDSKKGRDNKVYSMRNMSHSVNGYYTQ